MSYPWKKQRTKITTIAVAVAALLFLLFIGVGLQKFVSDNDVENISHHKALIEKGYVDGKFTQPKVKLENFIRYEVFAEGNTLTIDYNMAAERGRQFQKIKMKATKTEDGFKWTCYGSLLAVSSDC